MLLDTHIYIYIEQSIIQQWMRLWNDRVEKYRNKKKHSSDFHLKWQINRIFFAYNCINCFFGVIWEKSPPPGPPDPPLPQRACRAAPGAVRCWKWGLGGMSSALRGQVTSAAAGTGSFRSTPTDGWRWAADRLGGASLTASHRRDEMGMFTSMKIAGLLAFAVGKLDPDPARSASLGRSVGESDPFVDASTVIFICLCRCYVMLMWELFNGQLAVVETMTVLAPSLSVFVWESVTFHHETFLSIDTSSLLHKYSHE